MKAQTWFMELLMKRRAWGLATIALCWATLAMAQEQEVIEMGR
jgi:hypothetical protein